MTIRRIAIALAFAGALGGCATYDAGYRQGYADSHQRVAVTIEDGARYVDDYDFVHNDYDFGYGYPYEVGGFGSVWAPSFAGGPWFLSPWYGYGLGYPYPWYGWHRRWHHHDHGHPPHEGVAVDARMRSQHLRAGVPPGSIPSPADWRGQSHPFPARIPMNQRGWNQPMRDPIRPRPHHSDR